MQAGPADGGCCAVGRGAALPRKGLGGAPCIPSRRKLHPTPRGPRVADQGACEAGAAAAILSPGGERRRAQGSRSDRESESEGEGLGDKASGWLLLGFPRRKPPLVRQGLPPFWAPAWVPRDGRVPASTLPFCFPSAYNSPLPRLPWPPPELPLWLPSTPPPPRSPP